MDSRNESARLILEHADLVAEISAHTDLKQKGNEFHGLCPLHNEKTPSFTVSPQKGFFYCFGCHAKGDVISFVMQKNGIGFKHAIEMLASKYNITLPEAYPGSKAEDLTHELQCMRELAKAAKADGHANTAAQNYLTARGLGASALKHFHVGFSGALYHQRLKIILNQRESVVYELGLVTKFKKSKFQDRLIFPIQNDKGQVVGFGSRTMTDGVMPKYLNSSENKLFKKRTVLYGLYQFKQQKAHEVVIVEGYMDVLKMYEKGHINAVACMGTAFTVQQWRKLRHYAGVFYFCFDGDRAGRKAGWAALKTLLPELTPNESVRFIHLPDGMDPDSYFDQYGLSAFEALKEQSLSWVDLFFKSLDDECNVLENALDDVQKRSKMYQSGMELIGNIKNSSLSTVLSEELKKRVGVTIAQSQIPRPNQTSDSQAKVPKEADTLDEALLKQILGEAMRLLFGKTRNIQWSYVRTSHADCYHTGVQVLSTMLAALKENPKLAGDELLAMYKGDAVYLRLQSLWQERYSFDPSKLSWQLLRLEKLLLTATIAKWMHLDKSADSSGMLMRLIMEKKEVEKSLQLASSSASS